MPAKRRYNVKGTKDFIVLAGIFFFLFLWAVKDAWFPSPKVLLKHPHQVEVSFEVAGPIGQLHVQEGDSVHEGQVLAELRQSKLQEEFESAKEAYAEAKTKFVTAEEALLRNAKTVGAAGDGVSAELTQSRDAAQIAMDAALERINVSRATLDSSELISPSKGGITKILVNTHGQVEAGETVMVIDPKDHFYLFNKSLAIFSFIAFWVFLGVHILAH